MVGEESVRAALAPTGLIALIAVCNDAVDTFTADSADPCRVRARTRAVFQVKGAQALTADEV